VTHINKGNPFPLGSSLTSQGVNFSLVATNAEYIEILLFEKEDSISPKNILKNNDYKQLINLSAIFSLFIYGMFFQKEK